MSNAPPELQRRLSTPVDDPANYRGKFSSGASKDSFGHKHHSESVCGSCLEGICHSRKTPPLEEVDVVLIGGGIMSASVAMLLIELEPTWKIRIYERLDAIGCESSNGWNNAGTGHSALCELNYTPEIDGKIDISKALAINEKWQVSRQYWSYLVEKKLLPEPDTWINPTPHMTFVHGDQNVDFLKRRFELLHKNVLFAQMEYTENFDQIAKWAPLLCDQRDRSEKIACTKAPYATDVDFGALARHLVKAFQKKGGALYLYHTVTDLKQEADGKWRIKVQKLDMGTGISELRAKFVFVGAGGWALPTLQKSGIPEAKGFGGFPISGQFLVCQNPEVCAKHPAKIYGKASVGAPPMSVPHLDARIIDGKPMLLFGPYAGFSPKFLKTGSMMDLIKSIKPHNLIPMAAAGLQNLDLTVYLIKELLASKEKRMKSLREFMPTAKAEDWTLCTAGQRVQIMKKDPKKIGILQFGTEVVSSADGTIAGLLGASPGASVSVQVAIDVLQICFADKMTAWTPTLKRMIPSFGEKLNDNPALANRTMAKTAQVLGIRPVPDVS